MRCNSLGTSSQACVFLCPGTAARGRRYQSITAEEKSDVVLSDSEKELLRQMGNLFDSKQQGLQQSVQSLESGVQSLESGVQSLESGVQSLRTEFAEQQTNLDQQRQLLGTLVEASAREQVRKMFGENYEKSLLARSLQDLALLLPEEAVHNSSKAKQVLKGPLERAVFVSRALVEAGIPEKLLISLQEGAGESGWLHEDGRLDRSSLGRFLGSTPNAALRSTIVRLRRVLQLEKVDDQVQELILCESAGILCLMAAAFPEIYLKGQPNIFPSDELEIDCKGRMDVARDGTFSYIDLGEVKTRLDYATAVPQLGLRLGALKWFVCKACGAQAEGVRLVGRLFVFQQGVEEFVDLAQRDEASTKWGYSLYLHRV
jgi:exonuclease VII small subunit